MIQAFRILVIASLAVWPTLGRAQELSSHEAKCISDLVDATSKYSSCDLDARAGRVKKSKSIMAFAPETIAQEMSEERAKFDAALEKCADRFSEDWHRTLAKYPTEACTGQPFEQVLSRLRDEATRVGQLLAPIEATVGVGCTGVSAAEGAITTCPTNSPLTGSPNFNVCAWCTVAFTITCNPPSNMSSDDYIGFLSWSRHYSSSAITCTELSSGYYSCTNWDILYTHSVTTNQVQCEVAKVGVHF